MNGWAPGRRGPLFLLLAALLLAARPLPAGEYGSVARVNGVAISAFRLERHFEDYLQLQQRNVAAIRNPTVYKRLKHEALQQLIDKELLWQAALRHGIEVVDEDVERSRAQMAAAFASREAFERRLQRAGFDEASYREYLRSEIAASRMLDQLVPTVSVSEDEVRRFHAEHRERFAGLDEARSLSLVRQALLEQRAASVRRAALGRLRAAAAVEILLPR